MAKTDNQKLRILYVAKCFWEYSDENHSISAEFIIDYLQDEYGINSSRGTIYKDIADLRDNYGLDIEGSQGSRYRLLSRDLEYNDIVILAECVHAAKFISASKANELVASLCNLCSNYQAETLENEVFLCDRARTTQKGVLNNIALIRSAIVKSKGEYQHSPEKISFKYLSYSINDVTTQIEKHNGKKYEVSPFKILINDGNFYMLAYSDETGTIRTFRIDRMKNIQLTGKRQSHFAEKEFRKLNMENYTKRVFSMFSGEPVRTSLLFDNQLLDTVIEKFGTGVETFYRPEGSDQFVITTEVAVSDQFFAWVFGFGARAKIINPPTVAEQFTAYLDKVREMYQS